MVHEVEYSHNSLDLTTVHAGTVRSRAHGDFDKIKKKFKSPQLQLCFVAVAQAPSLNDLLHAVPDLLPYHILNVYRTRGEGIRILRHICKEVGFIALKAVRCCTMELRDPERVQRQVQLFHYARLLEVKLILQSPHSGAQLPLHHVN